MASFLHVLYISLVAFLFPSLASESTAGGKTAAVVAYLPEWRYEGANWETIAEHVTHLLLFSMEPDPTGSLLAHDRFPRKELIEEARSATRKHGTELMICFGGNGRSAGFSSMVRSSKRRARFLGELDKLMSKYDLDGVDYNWEYPGYSFGGGYHSDEEVGKDYKGLAYLIKETRLLFESKGTPKVVSMAYYPDSRQEQLIKQFKLDKYIDFMHMMSYDAGGPQHSTFELGSKSVDQGKATLPAAKLTMGVPFYGRHSRTGDWTTYEDLVQKHNPLAANADSVPTDGGKASIGFNGVDMIGKKTKYALEKEIGGVMIWEVGQDCRLVPVKHGTTTHVRTCPNDDSSLLLAITRALGQAGYTRMRSIGWKPSNNGKSEL